MAGKLKKKNMVRKFKDKKNSTMQQNKLKFKDSKKGKSKIYKKIIAKIEDNSYIKKYS